jgi:hypothetical protein
MNEVLIRFTVTSFQFIIRYPILSPSQLCKTYVFPEGNNSLLFIKHTIHKESETLESL